MDVFNSPYLARSASIDTSSRLTRRHEDFLAREIRCMADNIYYEARGESVEGKIAVAQVVINRTHYTFYPHTICGVVYDPSQFSWTNHRPTKKNARDYHKVVSLARAVLTRHLRSDIIGTNVVYYHSNAVMPDWADNMEPVAIIGNHLFYARVRKI